ncbi:MAG: tRNA (adenosine(37)-N6)-dimethylallyltransferase MiaA [Eubacteriales bacterium]
MDNIICIAGPTASGKTKLSVALAKQFNGEVLSCDSMQIYRHMDIGTAKPTWEEMEGVAHHMIDVADPDEDFSVGKYVSQADPILQDILSRGKTCVLVGGTGLYMDSLILGRNFAPYPATGRREELEKLADSDGIEAVQTLLRSFDSDSADRLHISDRRRIIRAAEVYLETGKTITQHNLETKAIPPKYEAAWVGLTFADRQDLYDRINLRVEYMVRDGLLPEIDKLFDMGIHRNTTSLQAIGYKEVLKALDGAYTMDDAIAAIQQESRRYAKRQMTWFRKNENIHWIVQDKVPDFVKTMADATGYVRNLWG